MSILSERISSLKSGGQVAEQRIIEKTARRFARAHLEAGFIDGKGAALRIGYFGSSCSCIILSLSRM
jgi:hypothetical protein